MATVNEKEQLNPTLDNKTIKQGEGSLSNSNPTLGGPEQFDENLVSNAVEEINETGDNAATDLKPLEENVLTSSYGAVSKDPDPLENDTGNPLDDAQCNLVEQNVVSNSPAAVAESFSPIGNERIERVIEDDLDDSEQEDCDEDVMTGSYGEISLDRELLNYDKNSDSISSRDDEQFFLEENKLSNGGVKEKKRPDSLVLTQNVISEDFSNSQDRHQQVHRSQQTSDGRTTSADVSPSFSSEEFAVHSSSRVRTGSDTSGLSELQGTLTIDGDLVTFVAEDLQEKIKMSSPVSKWTDSSFPGSRSSTPSLYRQALQPNLHIVDPSILTDLENHAKKVATCVDTMLENLSGTLQSISSLTVDCMETYESSVCKTCDSVDVNIKSVYQLMAKCEELSNSMNPLYKMSGDIKHIKKMLDQLEHIVEHKS